jgi:phenylacetate-CoA ligase
MIIPRGASLFPSRIQELVLEIPGLSPHFQCVLSRNGNLDAPTVRIERDEQATIDMARNAGRRVGDLVKRSIGVRIGVQVTEPGIIERSIGQMKRIVDQRPAR